MKEYTTIAQRAQAEFIERKSQFIGVVAPVSTEEEAQALIAEVRAAHRDATHNTFAYILNNGIKRCSDDGEPQGTAGVPILDVLQKEGLTNIVAVVTRYFGGLMLGAGGLVRAYSHGAKIAVDAARRQVMSPAVLLRLVFDYSLYGKISYLLPKYQMIVENSAFGETVEMQVLFKATEEEAFRKEITELTAATVAPEKIEERFAEFPQK